VKEERNARLREAADVMRRLWAGETVTHEGLVTVSEARLWTRPTQPPMLVGAAITPRTAGWVGEWADALITVAQPRELLRQVVDAFRRGGGEGKPMFLQVHLAYAPSEEEARDAAFEQWRQNTLPNSVMTELAQPAQIAAAATHVTRDDLDAAVRISSDPGRHAEWLREDLALGFEALYLHEVGTGQERFVEVFGREVIPALHDG
jgi:G6PDH family F420-dependent oxidoreductase